MFTCVYCIFGASTYTMVS